MKIMHILLLIVSASVPAAAWAQGAVHLGRAASPWPRVQALEPGSEIVLTVSQARPVQRYVIAVDDDSVRVLNLTDATIPGTLAETLRSIASQHPEYFAQAADGGTVVNDRVRLTKTGVFIGDELAVDWQRLVQTHARHDVAEIATRRRGRGFWGHLGPLGGFFVGGMTGGLVSGVACRAVSGRNRCDSGAFLIGMVGGGVAGGTYGWRAARRETEEVVYRAP
jgi:hypothetical protein